MPFAKIVPEMMVEPRSGYTISPVDKKNFPIKTPKSLVVMIINTNPAISLEFNFTTIAKFPSAIDYLLDGEDGA
jgi:hypothetical protein